MTQFKQRMALATTEELEKEFGKVKADLKSGRTNYLIGVLKLCIIDKLLCNKEQATSTEHN